MANRDEEETVVLQSFTYRPSQPRAGASPPTATAATAATEHVLNPVETKVARSPLRVAEEGPLSAAALAPLNGRDPDLTVPLAKPLGRPGASAAPAERSRMVAGLVLFTLAVLGGVALRVAGASSPRPAGTTQAGGESGEPALPVHRLGLRSSPLGAEVYEGSELLGRTPLELERPQGQRTQLKLVFPGRRPETRTFTFFHDDEATVALDVEGARDGRAGLSGR